jgi:UDP-N-acetylmuramoylalanine--D-glutamate ligase
MGLGLHGGGIASARFFASHGADVTVTDLRDEKILKPSIEALQDHPVRFVLGSHEMQDFIQADIVIKNPAVPETSAFLQAAKYIETDISIFLALIKNPVIAVTGSKGKSTTASAIHYVLQEEKEGAMLGGNITRSPLSFLDTLKEKTPVVLELSSWQLGDLRQRPVLKPKVAVITGILRDHQDKYNSMEKYIGDKKQVYRNQDKTDFTICNLDQEIGKAFAEETPGTPLFFSRSPLPAGIRGAYLSGRKGYIHTGNDDRCCEIVPEEVAVAGKHNRTNLLTAGLALHTMGIDIAAIRTRLAGFPGIEHRLEFFAQQGGVRFYNDSAATIPEAVVEALLSFEEPVHLIMGGTDKEIEFSCLTESATIPKRVYLLEGSAEKKIKAAFSAGGVVIPKTFSSLETAVRSAVAESSPGEIILLSPGCASFEMFLNEFDRGRRFKKIIQNLQEK